MKKIAIAIIILAILAGGIFFGYTKLKSIFGIEETKTDENGMKMVTLKKLPSGVKINFKVENSCEKPGHKAIKFSADGLKSAGVKEFGYSFTYVNVDTGALQGNGTTTPIKVQNDSYKPMTANCNEYGLFSCSAGGKCVFYTVNKVEGEYKFYMGGAEIGVWKESYQVK
jgi:hypothetical protein